MASRVGRVVVYDDDNLMHSGMFIDKNEFVRRNSLNRTDDSARHHTDACCASSI